MLLCALCLAAFTACASKDVVEKAPEMYWPLPPEKPRIKFVDIILGSNDVELKYNKVKNLLFGEETDSRFMKPFGVASRNRLVYVSDIGGIHRLDFEKWKYEKIGAEDLRMPAGIALTAEHIYVGDIAKKRVFVYSLGGTLLTTFGANELDAPSGVAVDERRGRVIVSDGRKHAVFVYNLSGAKLFSFGNRGKAPGEFNIPYGVAVDRAGRIYVVDSGNFRLQIFDEQGKYIKSIGSLGTAPGRFSRPKGVALDSDGNIYVLDSAFGNFQIFDLEGDVLLAVGGTGIEPAEFMLPSAIYINERDEIYIVDQVNKRVQIFQYLK